MFLDQVEEDKYEFQADPDELLASVELRSDREVVLAAVRQDWRAFREMDHALQSRELVLEALKQNVFALFYASEELKDDHDIRRGIASNWCCQ